MATMGARMAAYMFPGQGAQVVGMGKSLYERSPAARAVFDEVDASLQALLSRTLFEGPAAALSRTSVTQPALLAHSRASLRALEEASRAGYLASPLPPAACYLGHSVGEYAALVAGGGLGLGEAACLLRLRGEAMQRAGDAAAAPTAMQALLFSPPAPSLEALRAACTQACAAATTPAAAAALAALNSPAQAVLSGHASAVTRAVEILQQQQQQQPSSFRVRRAVPLPVSAPFHSPLMAPAAAALQAALTALSLAPLSAPLVAGHNARPASSPADVAQALVQGVASPVLWGLCVEHVLQVPQRGGYSGGTGRGALFVEFGAGGGTLGALARQCDSSGGAGRPKAEHLYFGAAEDLDRAASTALW